MKKDLDMFSVFKIFSNKKVRECLSLILFGITLSFLANIFYVESSLVKILILGLIIYVSVRASYEAIIYCIAFLLPYNLFLFNTIGQYTISFLQILWAIAFIRILINKGKMIKNIKSSILLSIMLFVLFLILSLSWTKDPLAAFKILLHWSLPMSFFVIGYFTNEKIRKNILKLVVISGIILSIISFGQWFYGTKVTPGIVNHRIQNSRITYMFIDNDRLQNELTNWNGGSCIRAFGTFANANNLPGYLGLMFYLFFPMSLFIKKYRMLLLILYTLFIGFIITLTGSTAGLIAFVVSYLAFIVLQKKNYKEKISAFLLTMILIVFMLSTNIITIRGLGGASFSWDWRVSSWEKAFRFIFHHPYGVGLGGYQDIVPHNIILLVGVFLGFIGIILFSLMIGRIFLEGIKSYKKAENGADRYVILAILCGFLWFFIQAQGGNIFISESFGMLFWLEAGMLLSFRKKQMNMELNKS
jgi:hypothetical protein